jgi:predicted membrane protein (TIGR00267 family)
MLKKLKLLFRISRSQQIARRYFVVNGFDGALTMLGLLMGFYVADSVELTAVVSACFGAAVALGVSGVSSAYISESAEKQHELEKLEQAMITDLEDTAYGEAARLMPVVVAMVNGLAPFVIAMVIISPLWFSLWRPGVLTAPIEIATIIAFVLIFLLGVFLGRVSGTFWLWSGLKALGVAALTGLLILLLSPN